MASQPRFKVYDIATLQALPKPPVSFVINPIVPLPGVTLLHGRWGTGKTAILMSEAVAVAEGKPFLGMPVTQGPVLVIEADMPDKLFRRRFYDLHQQLNPALPIKVIATSGFDALNPSFAGEALGQMFLTLNQTFRPVLVIVDTLRRTHGRDERESATSVEVYQYWMDTFPDSAVQILAHDRKAAINQRGSTPTPDEENFSGHQGWLNDAQSAIHIVPWGPVVKEKHTQLKLVHTKSQVDECGGTWIVQINEGGMGVELAHDTVMRTVDDIMKRMVAQGATEAQIDAEIAKTLEIKERQARNHKRAWRQERGMDTTQGGTDDNL